MDQNIKDSLAKKAEVELHETESRRSQSLEQFRKWLESHPYIKKTRQDDTFLSIFLRSKKYNLKETFKAFEKHMMFRLKHQDWFDVSDLKATTRLRGLIECGARYLVLDENSTEPVTFIQRMQNFHINSPLSDIYYMTVVLCCACLELEQVQICGFRLILDFTNVVPSDMSEFSINDAIDFIGALNTGAGRFKQLIFINLPPFVTFLYNIVKMLLPEKLKKRLFLIKTYEELKSIMDVSKLPERFGGYGDENECIEDTLELYDEKLDILNESNEFYIDVPRTNKTITSIISAKFRKLEID